LTKGFGGTRGGTAVFPPDGAHPEQKPIPSLVRAIARARDWYERIVSGKIANVCDLAKQARVSAAYVQRILPCAFLSPNVSEAILSGQQRPRITLEELLYELPIRWLEQERRFLGA
jgi:site-specific DNA recombinase